MRLPAAYAALHADAVDELTHATEQTELRERFLAHLSAHPDAMWREGPPTHFTASTLIFNEALTHTLCVLHKKAGLWLQAGGHFEETDASVAAAALREATEETGVTDLRPVPGLARVHQHALNPNFKRCRAHLDLRFAAIASDNAQLAVSEESEDVRWFPIDAIPQTDPDLPVELAIVARQLARV